MLGLVLKHLKNWFVLPGGVRCGTYTVENGSITLPFLLEGQHFRILGSVFNDGVYQYPPSGLTDETFYGTVWALAVPREVVELAGEIEAWNQKNGAAVTGPYQSESFGGYSYTLKTGSVGGGVCWQSAFASRLNQWRKI